MALTFFLNRKATTCVVSFKGTIAASDAECLDSCLREVTGELAKYLILSMGGISKVEAESARSFTLFQQALRGKSKLYLCDLQEAVGSALRAQGVLREAEVKTDLMACLQAIQRAERGQW